MECLLKDGNVCLAMDDRSRNLSIINWMLIMYFLFLVLHGIEFIIHF